MQPHILIAGVGNLFHGDDAFGSEVVRRLCAMVLPPEVRVVDFGIRGHDLAFALQDDFLHLILVDVTQRGGRPGELYLIKPDLEHVPLAPSHEIMDTHAMNPLRVIGLVQAMGAKLPRVWLVGCEPETFGPEEGRMGLSDPVRAAVPEAIARIRSLVEELLNHADCRLQITE